MKEIKKYLAFDGTVWNSERECLFHEKIDVEQMYEWAMKIKAYCDNMDSCHNCPFDDNTDDDFHCRIGTFECKPSYWEVDDFESDE